MCWNYNIPRNAVLAHVVHMWVINTFTFLPWAADRQLLPEPTADPGSAACHGASRRLCTETEQTSQTTLGAITSFPVVVWHCINYAYFWPTLVCRAWEELGNGAFSLAGCLNAITLSGAAVWGCQCSLSVNHLSLEKQSLSASPVALVCWEQRGWLVWRALPCFGVQGATAPGAV